MVRKYSMQEIFLKESYKKDKENFKRLLYKGTERVIFLYVIKLYSQSIIVKNPLKYQQIIKIIFDIIAYFN